MPYTLSPSKLSLFLDCPRCFWLEHNRDIKRPDGIFPSLPSGMDRVLKRYFDRHALRNEIPPEIQSTGAKVFNDMQKLDEWRTGWRGLTYEDKEGNVLKGAVDAILEKDGSLIVLDFKTRGKPLGEHTASYYQHQMDIYTYLLEKNGYPVTDVGYLLFYIPKKKDDVFRFTSELVEMKVDVRRAERLWKNALALLNGDIPVSSDCAYCSYREKVSLGKFM